MVKPLFDVPDREQIRALVLEDQKKRELLMQQSVVPQPAPEAQPDTGGFMASLTAPWGAAKDMQPSIFQRTGSYTKEVVTQGVDQMLSETRADANKGFLDILGEQMGDTSMDPLDLMGATYRYLTSRYATAMYTPEENKAAAEAYQVGAAEAAGRASAVPMSPQADRFQKDLATRPQLQGLMGAGRAVKNFVQAFANDPVGGAALMTEVGARSAPLMAISIAASAITKNPEIGAAFMGLSDGAVERYTSPLEFLTSKGVDITDPAQVREAVRNDSLMAEAKRYGVDRAAFIAVTDWISGLASANELYVNPLGNMAAEATVQALLGGIGDFGAQASTKGLNNIDWNDVTMEALAEFTTAPIEMVGIGRQYLDSKKTGTKTTLEQVLRDAAAGNKGAVDVLKGYGFSDEEIGQMTSRRARQATPDAEPPRDNPPEPPITFDDAQSQIDEATKDVPAGDAPPIEKPVVSAAVEQKLASAPMNVNGFLDTGRFTGAELRELENAGRVEWTTNDRGWSGYLEKRPAETPPGGVSQGEATSVDLTPLIRQIVEAAPPPPKDQIPDASAAPQSPPSPGKSAGLFLFDATSLGVDAKRFQFKEGGDQEGITNRLKGVKRWDPAKANQLMVWQSAEGQFFVVDGHQRSGLARRLVENGLEHKIKIPGLLYRETDGFTPEKMRALAAGKNLAEGSGTLLDAAKVLKVDPELIDDSMPMSDYKIRQATDLAKLGDEPFRMVINEVTDPEYGAIVGRLIPDNADQQTAAISALNKIGPANAVEAELVVRRVLNSQMAEAADQGPSLFGDALDTPESTVVEEIKIVAKAMAELKKDKAVFARVVKNADKIESVGSQINREASEGIVSESDRAIILLTTQSDTAGPVRTQLLELARDLKQGKIGATAAARKLAETIRSQPAFKTRGDDETPLAAMRPKRKAPIDTGTLDLFNQGAAIAAQDAGQNVRRRAEQLTLDGMGPSARQLAASREAAGQGRLKTGRQQTDANQGLFADKPDDGGFDFMVPSTIRVPRAGDVAIAVASLAREQWDQLKSTVKSSQPLPDNFDNIEDVRASLAPLQQDLAAAAAEIAAEFGINFKARSEVKSEKSILKKKAKKNLRRMKDLTDLVGVGFQPIDMAQSDLIIERLAARFGIIDEGWIVTEEGYFDRKVMVIFDNGVAGEIQLWPPGILEAKEDGKQFEGGLVVGHDLYEQIKEATSPEQADGLRQKSIRFYASVVDGLTRSFQELFSSSLSAMSGSAEANDLRNLSSGYTNTLRGSSNQTAEGSTSTQDPSKSSRAALAFEPSFTKTVGSPSQDMNDVVATGTSKTTDAQNAADVNSRSLNAVMALADAENVNIEVSENNGVITLSKIVSGAKRTAAGTRVMEALTRYADKTRQMIKLRASSQFGGDKARLIQFYERFGFTVDKRTAKASSKWKDTAMTRAPQPVSDAEAFIPRQSGVTVSGEPQRPATGIPDTGQVQEEIAVSKMISNFVRLLSLTFRTGRVTVGRDAIAQYNKKDGVIRARQSNDLSSIIHEGGHALHDARSQQLDALINQHQGEITQIALTHYGAPQNLKPPQLKREGFAEFFRLYVTNPARAQAEAPNFYAAFDNLLRTSDPTLHKGLQSLQQQIQSYVTTYPSTDVVKSFVQSAKERNLWDPRDLAEVVAEESQNARPYEGKPTVGGFFDWVRRGMFDMGSKAYTAIVDRNNGMRKLTYALLNVADRNRKSVNLKDADNPLELLAKASNSFLPAQLEMQYGVRPYQDTTHKGPSLRDGIAVMMGASKGASYFDMSEDRLADANAYLVALRALEEYKRFNAGELDRPPVGFSEADARQAVQDFEAKYGQSFIDGAKLVHQYARNLLDKEFAAGLITPETYDEIKDKPAYVPLLRDMSDKNQEFGGSVLTNAKASIVKRFRGSSRAIIAPLDALMHRTFATEKRIAENETIRAIARLADKAGRGAGAIAERISAAELERIQIKMEEVFQKIVDDPNISPADAAVMMGIFQSSFGGDEVMQIFRSTMLNERGERILTFRDGGKLQAIQLGDDGIGEAVFNVMRGLGHDKVPLLLDLVSRPSRMLRFGITKWPDFLLVNYFRDQFMAGVSTNVGYIPFATGAKGMWDVVRRKKAYLDYSNAMGIMGGVAENQVHKARVAKDIEGLKQRGYGVETFEFNGFNYKSLAGLVKGIFRLSELSEAGTRVGLFSKAYQRAIKEGLSEYDAIQEASRIARDYMDFGRVGSRMGPANRLIPFLNANIQGLDVTIRKLAGGGAVGRKALAFMEENRTAPRIQAFVQTIAAVTDGQRRKLNLNRVEINDLKNAQAMWVKMMGLALMSAALAFAYKDDPDYQEASEYLRQSGWLIPLGNGKLFYIPKPFEISLLGNMLERSIEYAYGDEKALGKFWDNFVNTVTPPFIPPAVSISVGVGANIDLSFGKPREIVPGYMDRLPPEQRALATTSEIAKRLGEALHYPPAKIDFLITSLFGSMGRDVSSMSDTLLNPDRAEKGVDDSFITRRFIRDANRGGMSSQDFNELANRMNGSLTQASAGYKRYKDVGDDAGAAEYLGNLTDDEKAWALLDQNFDTRFKRLHPIYRANQISTVISGMRREVLTAQLNDTETEGETIPLTAKDKRLVDDFLTDIQRRERRNALIAIGHPSWKNKKPLPIEPSMELLREASPAAADELERRLGKAKVYDGADVAANWPELKQRLLTDGPDAVLTDLLP